MLIKLVTPVEWIKLRDQFIGFLIRHGDYRLTAEALRLLRKLNPEQLAAASGSTEAAAYPASAVVVAYKGKLLIGVGAALDCGKRASVIAVHGSYRSQGIGTRLLKTMLERCGSLTCLVAPDNLSSMHACFRAGMTAIQLVQGSGGKPVLKFNGAAEPGGIAGSSNSYLHEGVVAWHNPSSAF